MSQKTSFLNPNIAVRSVVASGLMILAGGFGGMTAWSAYAPLHSAVVAPGQLVPESGRKTVKHTEGGNIAKVLVKEGDRVTAGTVLLQLDRTEADARLQMLQADYNAALASEARLSAELAGKAFISWPNELYDRSGTPQIAKLIHDNEVLFKVRRTQEAQDRNLLDERIAAQSDESANLEEQRQFIASELGIIQKQIGTVQHLLKNGNAPKARLWDLQKEEAQLQARDRELGGRVATLRQQVAEARAEQARREETRREEALKDVQEARKELARLAESMLDAKNRVANRDIKAPDDGIVVGLGNLTVGSVIADNEAILDVVPEEQELIADVHVTPKDIEALKIGMDSRITLSAYDSRTVGTMEGTVEQVSADKLVDHATQQPYYKARIRLKDADAHEVHNLRIIPGMPVEAHILISARTPMDYLLSPITKAYSKAFIEQ